MDAALYHHDSDNGFDTYWTPDGQQLAGLGDDSTTPSTLDTILADLTAVGTTAVAAASAPKAAPPAAATTSNALTYGLIAVAGFGLLYMLMKKKRR